MAYEIGDSCISCGSCEGQCPVGAISKGEGKFQIEAAKSVDSGSCAGQSPLGGITEG